MSARQAFPAQPPGPRQARPVDAQLSHLRGCSDVCRLLDKDQEETQTSTRAVHILQVGRERGWAVPGAPSRPRLRLLRAPCCLAEGPMVKTAGVWSGTRGQGLPCHGRGRAPAGRRVRTQPDVPQGLPRRKDVPTPSHMSSDWPSACFHGLRALLDPISLRVPPSHPGVQNIKEQQREGIKASSYRDRPSLPQRLLQPAGPVMVDRTGNATSSQPSLIRHPAAHPPTQHALSACSHAMQRTQDRKMRATRLSLPEGGTEDWSQQAGASAEQSVTQGQKTARGWHLGRP